MSESSHSSSFHAPLVNQQHHTEFYTAVCRVKQSKPFQAAVLTSKVALAFMPFAWEEIDAEIFRSFSSTGEVLEKSSPMKADIQAKKKQSVKFQPRAPGHASDRYLGAMKANSTLCCTNRSTK